MGPPLSFRSIIVMGALSHMLGAAVDSCFLPSFSVGGVNISHLLIANDTLPFSKLDIGHIQYLKVLLLCFEVVSILNVTLLKSEMILVGSMVNVQCLASISACKVSSFLMKYLILPLEATFKAKSIWDRYLKKLKED